MEGRDLALSEELGFKVPVRGSQGSFGGGKTATKSRCYFLKIHIFNNI